MVIFAARLLYFGGYVCFAMKHQYFSEYFSDRILRKAILKLAVHVYTIIKIMTIPKHLSYLYKTYIQLVRSHPKEIYLTCSIGNRNDLWVRMISIRRFLQTYMARSTLPALKLHCYFETTYIIIQTWKTNNLAFKTFFYSKFTKFYLIILMSILLKYVNNFVYNSLFYINSNQFVQT